MKNILYRLMKYIIPVMAVFLLAVACSDDDTAQVPERLFRPPFINDSIYASNNTLHVAWYAVKGAVNYTVELGQDDFQTIIKTVITEDNYVIFDDLQWDTAYEIRLMAVHPNPEENSRYAVVEGGLKTEAKPTVNIFNVMSSLSSTEATVSWGTYYIPPTKLLVYKNGTLERTITDDIESGTCTLSNLTPETDYTLVLGTDNENMEDVGTLSFTTYPSNIITVTSGSDLATAINNAPDGSTFLLPSGSTYSYQEGGGNDYVNIVRSFTLIGGVGENKARFCVVNGFAPKADTNVDHMRFVNLEINGYGDGAQYVTGMFIAEGGANSTLNLVEFKDCDILHSQWAFIYLKAENQVVNHVLIDNCTLTDLGSSWGQEAPICGVQATNSGYNNITMINSTLTNCPAGVVTSNKPATGNIHIENCTFYNTMRAPFMLINYKTNNVIGTVTVKNSLFGANYSPLNATSQTVGAVVNGTALSNSGFIVDNYMTNDCTMELNPIPGTSSTGTSSATVFRDPVNNDLTIVSQSLKRFKPGDPRWY